MNTLVRIAEQTQKLPEPLQQEVLDFIEFLQHKHALSTVQANTRKRQAGLHAGLVSVADDFDAPLEDTFWLGQS